MSEMEITDHAISNFLQRENDSFHEFLSKLEIPPHSSPSINKTLPIQSLLLSNSQIESIASVRSIGSIGSIDQEYNTHENIKIIEDYELEKKEMLQNNFYHSRRTDSSFGNITSPKILSSKSEEEDLDENEVESVPLPPSQYSNNVIELSESTVKVFSFSFFLNSKSSVD